MNDETMQADMDAVEAVEQAPDAKKVAKSDAAQARYAAIKELIRRNQDEFNALYVEQAEKFGVRTRASSKAAKIAKLEKQLADLQGSN